MDTVPLQANTRRRHRRFKQGKGDGTGPYLPCRMDLQWPVDDVQARSSWVVAAATQPARRGKEKDAGDACSASRAGARR
jgi:hypothetical protein